MNIEEKLLLKRETIEAALDRLLPQGDTLLTQAMRYAVLSGGKRFRSLLALSSGECFGISQGVVLPFASAVELIHNYSLIHDDLPMMDNDDFRRGKLSCHKAYREDIALLAGDGLLTLAFEVLASAPVENEYSMRKERLILEIAQSAGIDGMVGGQLLDITLTPDNLSEELLLDLMARKTGALILGAVKVGPILAGASPQEFQALLDYGQNIGMAFQMRDDILDLPETSSQDSSLRPNAASYFGVEEANTRLQNHVQSAIKALDRVSLESEELRFLASGLVDLNRER
jgi:geranylgeranyl diphosphate synthase type II